MTNINPSVLAGRKPRLLPKGNLAELQAAYRVNRRPVRALGERNPNTLPGLYRDSESVEDNKAGTRYWQSLRKQVQAGRRLNTRLF